MDPFDAELVSFPTPSEAETLKRPPPRSDRCLRVAPTWGPPQGSFAVWEAIVSVRIPRAPRLPTILP